MQESKVGMRWRTEQEVVQGKGQFICGAKGCDERRALASFEVMCHHSTDRAVYAFPFACCTGLLQLGICFVACWRCLFVLEV